MKIASWNVNGIRATAKKGFFEWLAENNYDIIGIQETKAHQDQLGREITAPKGYPITIFNSAERKGYSGVASYFVKEQQPRDRKLGFDISVFKDDNLPPKINEVSVGAKTTTIDFAGVKELVGPENADKVLDSSNFTRLTKAELEKLVEDFNKEGRLLETRHRLNGEDVLLFNIYFPNGGSGDERLTFKLQFYEVLTTYLEELLKDYPRIIVGGDYNTAHTEIDLARPKQNTNTSGFMPVERVYMDKLQELGFKDSFRHFNPDKEEVYTWWSYRAGARDRNVGWRIDYFYVSEALLDNLVAAEIHTNVTGSDHCPVTIELKETPAMAG